MRFLDLDGCPYEDFGNSKCQGSWQPKAGSGGAGQVHVRSGQGEDGGAAGLDRTVAEQVEV